MVDGGDGTDGLLVGAAGVLGRLVVLVAPEAVLVLVLVDGVPHAGGSPGLDRGAGAL